MIAAALLLVGVAALAFAATVAAEGLLAVFIGSIPVVWVLTMSGHAPHAGSGRTHGLTHA